MPKKILIWLITLLLFLGYLILFISTTVTWLLAKCNRKLNDGITKLQWVRSNIRIQLWREKKH